MANEHDNKRPPTEEELAQRQERQDNIDAGSGVEDGMDNGSDSRADEGDNGQDHGGEPAERTVVHMSPADAKRQKMQEAASRLRGSTIPFDGDLTRDENLYGEAASEVLEPDEDLNPENVSGEDDGGRAADTDRQGQDAPKGKTFKLKIRGQEVELTEDQVLERASKVDAADSYLKEARDLLESAKSIVADRSAGDRHPDQSDTNEPDANRSDTAHRPAADDLRAIVDKIQFGDPEEAASALGDYIARTSKEQATEGHLNRLYANDLARAQVVMKDFSDANPQIAKNRDAARLMEMHIYDVYRDDLVKIGLDPATIPQDNQQLAHWHRHYRVNGHQVSTVPQVFEKAKGSVEKAMNLTPSTPRTSTQPANRKPGEVRVSIDRSVRREAIPTQPSRTAAPQRQAAAQPATQESSRKQAIQDMRRSRGQPVVKG